jgi:lipopolysaccharide export LptBFGC system permease protein LptF
MLRALEIFWLSLTVFCLLALAFSLYIRAGAETLLLGLFLLIAGFKYYVRRKQRKAMEKK